MKIGILGAGATGSIYAGYLCNAHEVWMIDTNQKHISAVKDNGLAITHDGETTRYYPHAVTTPEEAGCCDLVILLVKTYQSDQALASAAPLFGPQTLVLSLQNGLGNQYALERFCSPEQILLGTCAQGGSMLGPGEILHIGAGATEIGSICGNKTAEARVYEALTSAGIPRVSVVEDILQTVWKKVIRNAGINAITALLRRTTNVVITDEHANALCRSVVYESVDIANACGCQIDKEKMLAVLFDGAQRNGLNRTSMLQDVEHERRTEILQINGAIAEEGRRHGIEAPYNTALTALVLALENGYSPTSPPEA